MKYLFCVHSPRRARDSAWRFDLVFFRLLSPGGAVGEYSREGSSRPRCRGVRREGGKGIGGQAGEEAGEGKEGTDSTSLVAGTWPEEDAYGTDIDAIERTARGLSFAVKEKAVQESDSLNSDFIDR
ncbi:hypothetical protein FH972_027000 [Carpinus fangiana]|uniref:Uncharacterized protein n=1 Tax=Carpinus fangiana TaxID=176857 RepID=A0A5N6L6F2_9ROSI|nr:hypothetical protein FH972_027000 [Carpinus fangiana]